MYLEKNPKTRLLALKLLQLEDRLKGKPFSSMTRTREISNYSCGPATLAMLLSFVGYRVSQRKLIKSIRAQNRIKIYGVSPKDMAKSVKIASKKELIFWKKENASINDLFLVVHKFEYPVGVEWQGDFFEHEDEDKGHYAVVTKVDKNRGLLRISDPFFNSFLGYEDLDRKYKISEFFKKWWDVNEIKISGTSKLRTIKDIRIMFVITPKGDLWPKKLGMKKA